MNPALREILIFAVWLPFALPVGVAYGHFLKFVMERPVGLEGGAMVVIFPAAIMFIAIVLWLPAWSYLRQRRHRRLGWLSLPIAVLLSAGFVFIFCSANCFLPSGPNPFLAYFIISLVAMAALAHDRLSRAWLKRAEQAA
ncbi:MAG: hypothetical protein HKN60_00450 [Rhizobiales bacterium]|nr:hypothetical protein [Hyphomicrobiales bacterium]